MISRPGLSFAEDHSVWFFLAVSCLAVGLVVYFYKRVAPAVPRRTMLMLVILRVIAVGMVIVCLFRPVISFRRRATRAEQIAVLIDRSKSMSITDYPNVPGRLEQVQEILAGGGVLDDLGADFELKMWAFDVSAEPVPGEREMRDLIATGGATQIASAIGEAVSAAERDRLHGVLIFTDGMDTSGADVVERTRELGVRAYCVGVGAKLIGEKDFRDISIAKVETKRSCPVDNITEVAVLVEAVNFKGLICPVSIWQGEAEVARTTVTLDNVPGPQRAVIRFTPHEKGLIEYKAVITVQGGERISENNESDFTLNVTDPQIRVLHIAGTVGPEYKYLARMMRLDPNIQPMSFIKVKAGLIKRFGEVEGVGGGGLPASTEALKKFDVIVLGDIDATHFKPEQLKAIAERVSDGAGLVMLRGKGSFGAGGYALTPLAEALPVTMAAREDGELAQKFRMKLSETGRAHPVFTGLVSIFEGADAGVELHAVNRVKGLRPGSEVLASGPDDPAAEAVGGGEEGRGGGPMPVLVTGQFGKGRTAAFLGGPTYRWLLLLKGIGRESPYSRYWGQLVRWLASEEVKKAGTGPGVEATLDAAVYGPGEVVTIDARVRDVEGLLTNTAKVTAAVELQEAAPAKAGPGATLQMARSTDATGAYEATYTPAGPGRYRLTVVATEEGVELGKKELSFVVGEPNLEFERFDLDEQLLKNLADSTGGRYVTLAAVDDLVAEFQSHASKGEKAYIINLANTPLLFVIFVILVTVEWLTRRRWQLS